MLSRPHVCHPGLPLPEEAPSLKTGKTARHSLQRLDLAFMSHTKISGNHGSFGAQCTSQWVACVVSFESTRMRRTRRVSKRRVLGLLKYRTADLLAPEGGLVRTTDTRSVKARQSIETAAIHPASGRATDADLRDQVGDSPGFDPGRPGSRLPVATRRQFRLRPAPRSTFHTTAVSAAASRRAYGGDVTLSNAEGSLDRFRSQI